MRPVASGTPTTAGMPYSRATTAPCDIIPPISMTRAPAVRKSGVQPGSVDGATSTSPGSSRAPTGERMTRATPRAIPGEAGVPRMPPSVAAGSSVSASVPSEEHTRDVTAALLAPIDLATLRDRRAQVLAGDRAAQFRQGEEEHIVGGVE